MAQIYTKMAEIADIARPSLYKIFFFVNESNKSCLYLLYNTILSMNGTYLRNTV